MPFQDNRMRYDYLRHRYVLVEEYVLEAMNIDLRDILNTSASADIANAVEVLLDRISEQVYGYIYRVVPLKYETEKKLATDELARECLLRAMHEQLLYALQNGDLGTMAGINVANGTQIDRAKMRSAEIAPMAEDAIFDIDFVRSNVERGKRDIIPDYDGEGY